MARAHTHGGGTPRKAERNAQIYRAFLQLAPDDEHKLRRLSRTYLLSKPRIWVIIQAERRRETERALTPTQ